VGFTAVTAFARCAPEDECGYGGDAGGGDDHRESQPADERGLCVDCELCAFRSELFGDR
jgi:hypothetical protein